MKAMLPFSLCLSVCLLAFVAQPGAASVVDIGGDPIHVEQDVFTKDNWAATVTSFVFSTLSASLPTGFGDLDSGEMLFVYFLDMDNNMPTSVNNFNVGNPGSYPINTVGWVGPASNTPVVDGNPTTDTFQDPYLYGYSGPAQASVFTYSGNFFDPWCTLDPSEYSLVYYVAVCSDWQPVDGTVSGGGISDNELVPGPGVIPEPSLLIGGLVALGLMLKGRRR